MAGAIEELFSILKIVPDENNLQNISEHLNGFDNLIQNFTSNLKELTMQQLVNDTGGASENLKKAGINVDAIKRNLPNVERSVGGAEKNAGKFKNEVKGANENLDEAARKSQLLTNYLHDLNIVGGWFKGIVGGWVNGMKSFVSESLNAGNEFQKMRLSLQGVFGDEKMADDFIAQLQTMEKASKFSKGELSAVALQLMPTFENSEQVMAMLNDIQRIAQVGEKGGASLNGMANALVQINNTAQISKRELKMLGSASGGTLNLFTQLQKDLGKSKSEMDKMLKEGLISKSQLAKAIQNASAEFGTLPEQIGDTYDAVFGRVKENIQQNLGKALLPIANALKPLAEELEKTDFTEFGNKVKIFADALVAASPMILNIAGALFKFSNILMSIAAPFAQITGLVLNFIASTPGLNAAFIGLLGVLGMKGLLFVLQLAITKMKEIVSSFISLSVSATATSAEMASAGIAASVAGTQIAGAGTAANITAKELSTAGMAAGAMSEELGMAGTAANITAKELSTAGTAAQIAKAEIAGAGTAATATAANLTTAGTAAQVAKGQIANVGTAASVAGTQIAGAGRAINTFTVQASTAPVAMARMVGGLSKVAMGVRMLGRTIKATLIGIGPAGWAMLGIGAAAEIYAHYKDKKESKNAGIDFNDESELDLKKTEMREEHKVQNWTFNNENNFQLDREGKTNMSKEMLETAIKEQTRSILNMEIMRVLEVSEQAGAVGA